jgi:SAM-dependent methyltransferase
MSGVAIADPLAVSTGEEPTHGGERRCGEAVHRAVYRAIGRLPLAARSRILGSAFDTLFRLTPDAWAYDSSPYEATKRAHLIRSIPSDAKIVLEFGCANGHNVEALARSRPGSRVVGVDVSHRAIAIARQRMQNLPNASFFCTAGPQAWSRLRHHAPLVDVVVLSEVLYYLGSADAVVESLYPLRDFLHAGSSVVMAHGGRDASTLHKVAAKALSMHVTEEFMRPGDGRPYTLSTARTVRQREQLRCVA